MKTILLSAALAVATSSVLCAQNSPNREGIGEAPGPGAPAAGGEVPPARDNKLKGTEDPNGSGKSADERFVHKAGKAGKMEVKMAELGASTATREDLKAFSAMLIKDHGAANMELAGIAKSIGVEIPEASKGENHEKGGNAHGENDPSGRKTATSPPGDPKGDAEDNKHHELKEKSGVEFDAAYITAMQKCHARDIALFEKSEGEVKSPELKGFITKTLPVLKRHAAALATLAKKDPSGPDTKIGGDAPRAGRTDPAEPKNEAQPNR